MTVLGRATPWLLLAACGLDQNFGDREGAIPPADPDTRPSVEPELTLSEMAPTADVVQSLGGAFDGEQYLLVWRGLHGLMAVRLDAAAKPIDAKPFRLVPPTDAGGAEDWPHVFARAGGGFRVLWTDEGGGADATRGIHGLWVERDGSFSRPVAVDLGPGVHVQSVVAIDQDAAEFRAVYERGGEVTGSALSFRAPDLLLPRSCFTQSSFPGLVPGTLAFARAGQRNILGGLVASGSERAIVLAESELGCSTSLDPVRELLRVPLRFDPQESVATRPVDLVSVAGGVFAVWFNTLTPTSSGIPAQLEAVLVPPLGPLGMATVLATGITDPSIYGPNPSPSLGVVGRGDEVLLPLNTMGNPSASVALRVDPTSMATRPIAPAYDYGGGSVRGIVGPDGDYLLAQRVSRHATVGAAMKIATIHGTTASHVPWSPPESAAAEFIPSSWSSIRHPRTACSAERCTNVWFTHYAHPWSGGSADALPRIQVAHVPRDGASSRPIDTLRRPGDTSSFLWGPPAVAIGPANDLVVMPLACGLRVQSISPAGEPGAVREIEPEQCHVCSPPRGDLVADGDSFVAVSLVGCAIATFRLAADGALLERRLLPFDGAPEGGNAIPVGHNLVRVADRNLAVAFHLSRSGAHTPAVAVSFPSRGLDPNIVEMPDDVARASSADIASVGEGVSLVWIDPDVTRPRFRIRELQLDPLGNVVVAPRDLAAEEGDASRVRVAGDGDGILVSYGHRSSPSDRPRLLVRRFSRAGVPRGIPWEVANQLPIAAEGNHSGGPEVAEISMARFDAALAASGPKTWFVTYPRQPVEGSEASTLFGRFVRSGRSPSIPPR